MLSLILAIACAVLISFTCSLSEAALYAVPWSSIERMRSSGSDTGELLFTMRTEVDKPIAAILTLNTVANTAGATIAGGAFLSVFGPRYMEVFAAGFTLLILAFGEIVPKTLGVAHATPIARFLARPLAITIKLLTPVICLSSLLTRLLAPAGNKPQVSEADISAMAGLSRKSGRIKPYEEHFIKNVLSLDQKHVYDIMTPRTVVFSLSENLTVDEAYGNSQIWHFSRIPVYAGNNEDIVGVVERRALARCLQAEHTGTRLSELMKPIHFVQESQTLDLTLREMLKAREHLFVALDEYGGLAGVVSLEDVLEELLGHEIVDESDTVADMRALARNQRKALLKNANSDTNKNNSHLS